MESIAKGLVGQEVEITMSSIRGTFHRKGKITSVRDGIITLKGASGMEFPLPIKDKWACVTLIRAILSDDEIIGTA